MDTHCRKFPKKGGTGAGTHKPVHPYAVLVPPPRFSAVPTTQVDDEMGCAKNEISNVIAVVVAMYDPW